MNQQHQPRLKNLDLDFIQRALNLGYQMRANNFEAKRRGQIKRLQSAYAGSVDNARLIGLYLYALGHPLPEVRSYLAEAGQYMREVFKLRGTQDSFPVTIVTGDARGRIIKQEPLHPPGYIDYSLTNSADGLEGICLALIAGDLELAKSIAEMIGDPEDADYIGLDSEVCTPDQQHLAYAVKHLLLEDTHMALTELALVNIRTATVDVRCQATMVHAIAAQQRAVFLQGLIDLLDWHQTMARRKMNLNDPDFFLSLPGLGLCVLAFYHGVGQWEQLPGDSVYLPVDLIRQGTC
jgi:hypothetical protein